MAYTYEVVAELREDLSAQDRQYIENRLEKLQQRFNVCSDNGIVFHKVPPIVNQNDFGAVCFFFWEISDDKRFFKKLEYYDYNEEDFRVTV